MKKIFTIQFFASIKRGNECIITSHFAIRQLFVLLFSFILLMPTTAFSQSWLWAKSAGGNINDDGYSVTTDAAGNVYITGSFFSSSISFETYTLTNAGGDNFPPDIFLVKYDPSGKVLWAKSAGGTSWDDGYSVTTDAIGNVYVTGTFQSSSITFGATTLTNASSDYRDIFLVKYDPSGNILWAKSAGGTESEEGNSVTTDAAGNVYVTGSFSSSSISFGTTTLTNANAGYRDIFLVKYDWNGNVLWVKSAGGTNNDEGYGVTTDAIGNVYVTGAFQSSSISFRTTTLTNAANGDIFVAKLGTITGIEGISTENNIQIYPNPATTETTIKMDNEKWIMDNGNVELKIYNMMGHEVYRSQLKAINSKVNLSTLPSGVYLVKVMYEKNVWTNKLIIQSELK